jgi:hypothetical protein
MESFIIITSINHPTDAVSAYARLSSYQTIVVGDAKTPSEWKHDGVDFFSLKAQYAASHSSAIRIPENHYSRKNLGYLKAIQQGAKLIVDTDDDNIPYDHYAAPAFEGIYDSPEDTDEPWVNMYKYYTDAFIWPRGFPLDKIRSTPPRLSQEFVNVAIWQGLADKDPDVDAIYRLTSNQEIIFKKRAPVVLRSGSYCPLNSQNTTFHPIAFPLLYLPHTVTFRFTDILRGLVALAILEKQGKRIGFHEATVYQERNPHNLLDDFESEIPCYTQANAIPEILSDALDPHMSIQNSLLRAYTTLANLEIVDIKEVETLKAWLNDLVAAGYEA